MSLDISTVLNGWDYDPEDLQARVILGDDGREKVQMRVDLGLFQMEMEGRPDGRRPHGFVSLLDYHEAQAQRMEHDAPEIPPGIDDGETEPSPEAAQSRSSSYRLDESDRAELLREGMQYYHRYLSLFHLKRYDLVIRDTTRNLRLFAFVRAHVQGFHAQIQFDRFRPYVLMMRTRAQGLQALEASQHELALERIDAGIEGIREFLRDYQQTEDQTNCVELLFLRRWRQQLQQSRTIGPIQDLERQLALAVVQEEYEVAARLRDRLRELRRVEPSEPEDPPRSSLSQLES